MSNALVKTKTVRYIPGSPGIPPSFGVSQRYVEVTRQVCQFYDVGTKGNVRIWSCRLVKELVMLPAVPASNGTPGYAAREEVDYNLGWNSGARSIKFFRGDGYGQFKIAPSVVGVVVGLNVADSIDARYAGSNIDYAIAAARGAARIVENNVFVASLGTYTDTTVFKIRRSGTDIIYSVNGTDVHTTTGASSADLFLEAALYAGDDKVFDPSIVQTSPADLTTQTGSINATLPALGSYLTDAPRSDLIGVLPAMTVNALAGIAAPAYALMGGSLPALFSDITSLTGGIHSLNGVLPAMDVLAADHAYSELFGVLPAIFGGMVAVEGNTNASMEGSATVVDTLLVQNSLVVTFDSTGIVANFWTIANTMPVVMDSSAAAAVVFNLSTITSAVMNSSVIGGWVYSSSGTADGDNPPINDGTETWAVNLQTNGSTQYENYGFNSFATFNGKYYGAKSDGLYLLEGDTDAGALIRARAAFGKLDFGTTEKVTVEQCYVGMSGQGNLFLKVIANGVPYIYSTRSFSDQLQQQRVTTGKGLRTNYVELEIYNADGADFELDTVKFIVADLSRKI